MTRTDTPVERIQPPDWMREKGTHAVLRALTVGTDAARFVGGCVRDTLLGRAIGDIDVATPLPPDEVMQRLSAADIKAVPTGIAHGTVTAVTPERTIEITTLRRDVETFGRHARVAFTTEWVEDARRRDFTMNALFLDAEGAVFDPVGGLGDLRAGYVRFVGDAATRIREDVLRLLRFYRFHAWYGRGDADHEARAACGALAHLVPMLSGKRVSAELLKLLAAPDPIPTLRLMSEDGVLAALSPTFSALARLAALWPLEPEPDPLRRLAALVEGDAPALAMMAERLRLSSAARERLLTLAAPARALDLGADAAAQRRAIYHLGAERYRDHVLLRAAATGDAARGRELLALVESWPPPPFPLKGRDVTALGVPVGPEVGRLLGEVEAWWQDGDFRADRQACLAELRRRVSGR